MPIYKQTTEITNIDDLLSSVERDIEEVYFGDKQVFTVWATYDSSLPAQYSANGDYLADYRIYGASGGVGDYVAPEYKQIHTDTVTIDGIVWDILGYDHDIVYKSDNTLAQHSVTLQAHDVLSDMQFDAKEALFAFDNGLAAGTYHFTVGVQPWYAGDVGKTIQFTLTSALPAGGQLVINNAYNATMVGSTISSYTNGTATTATETVTMSEGSSGTDLGTVTTGLSQDGVISSIQRAIFGSNNWHESSMRQYLNSSASAGSVWEPKTKWDRPPAWATNTAGFLNGMSADFIANLGTASKTTALNTVTDSGGTEATLDKVFLVSRSEVYTGDEVTGGEGAVYPYYSDFSDLSAPGTGADTNRTKSLNGAAKYWWLRSPDVGSASTVRLILATGALNYNLASSSFGVAPACCIPLDDIDTNNWLREKFLKNPSTAYGYEVEIRVSDGATITANSIYIGSSPLEKDEYVDYGEGKIYRRFPNLFNISSITNVKRNNVETVNGFSNIDNVITFRLTVGEHGAYSYNSELTFEPNVEYQLDCDIYLTGISALNYIAIALTDIAVTTLISNEYFNYEISKDSWVHVNVSLTPTESVGMLRIQARNTGNYIQLKNVVLRKSGFQPTDPPVPLPALSTVDGTNIVDYGGRRAPVPSRFYAKYRKQNF